MDKIECLNCQKGFTPERETAKFCSTNCRVKYHRKHGKKDEVKPFQMKVLYTSMMEMIEGVNERLKESPTIRFLDPRSPEQNAAILNAENKNQFTMVKQMPLKTKSFAQYQSEKKECEVEEQWEVLKAEIENDPNLSRKQKDLLIKYS